MHRAEQRTEDGKELQGGGDLLPMKNQCNYSIWLSSSKTGSQPCSKQHQDPAVCELLLTCLSQSKHPVSQQELNSRRSPESPCRPPCLTRPFAASSNTLMHSIYSWERGGGDNCSAECVWEGERGGLFWIGQTRGESVVGPAEMPSWWMREKLLCSPEFGEFTETGPINNDPEVEASLLSANE